MVFSEILLFSRNKIGVTVVNELTFNALVILLVADQACLIIIGTCLQNNVALPLLTALSHQLSRVTLKIFAFL